MKIICRENCSGKTKDLIKTSLETGAPILTMTPRKEQSLKEKSIAYFGEVVKTIDPIDAKSYQGKILIDDMEELIEPLIKNVFNNNSITVEGITLSI